MILPIAVPQFVGALLSETSELTEREKEAREERMDALGEVQSLIDNGYEPIRVEMKYTDHGAYQVFYMERKSDQTDLDPQTAASHANTHAGT